MNDIVQADDVDVLQLCNQSPCRPSRCRVWGLSECEKPAHSPFIKLISRIAVLGVPSSASRWISFKATISDVVRDRPCESAAILALGRYAAYLVHCRVRPLAELLQLNVIPAESACVERVWRPEVEVGEAARWESALHARQSCATDGISQGETARTYWSRVLILES